MNASHNEHHALMTAAQQLYAALSEVIYGKPDLLKMVTAAFLAEGHVLLEGLPGLGKTVLAKSLAAMTGLEYKRIQFTPDLLPADITGTHILENTPQGHQTRFIAGPIFTHFLLADEINRASAKTQAALLEAMSEQSVTLMGEQHRLAAPFFVMATQNPIEMEGTNPLPEAQLDRFAVKLQVNSTDEATLLRIIREHKPDQSATLTEILSHANLLACQQAVATVFVPEAVAIFIAHIVAMTHPEQQNCPQDIKSHVRYGVSPRGAIWLNRLAQALAFLDGRTSVGFEDVIVAVPHVLGHRLILHYTARFDGITTTTLLKTLVEKTEQHVLSN